MLQDTGDRARTLVARADAHQGGRRGSGTPLQEPLIVVNGRHGSHMGVHDQNGALIGFIAQRDGVVALQTRNGRMLDDDGQPVSDSRDLCTVRLARRKTPVPLTVLAADGSELAVVHREGLDGDAPPVIDAYGSRYRRHPVTHGKTVIGWLAIPHRRVVSIGSERDWLVEDDTHTPKAHIIWASRDRGRPGFVSSFEDGTSARLRCVAIAAMIAGDHARGTDHP